MGLAIEEGATTFTLSNFDKDGRWERRVGKKK